MSGLADYELAEKIGSANHGDLHLAVPPARLGLSAERVVVKVLHRHADEDEFRRVGVELRLFASIRSPHLIEVYDAGHDGGRLWYAMAHHPEGSLEELEPDPQRACRAIAAAARGAHDLHEHGVVHRDIKPATVLLDGPSARLGDLGLARLLWPGHTQTATGPIGSIEFTDPALLRGDDRGSRASDIWSLGVTLHRSATGHGVFGDIPDDGVVSGLRHVLSSPPRLHPDLPENLRAIVRQCLEPSPADRPSTAAELADHLDVIP